MTNEKKQSIWAMMEKAGKVFAFLTIIGVGIGILIKYGGDKEAEKNWKNNLKTLIFDSPDQKRDTKDLLDIEYHPVKQMRQSDTLIQQQKELAEQLERSNKLTTIQNSKLDSIKAVNIRRNKKDSIDEIRRMQSRVAREYKIDQIIKTQRIILDSLQN